MSELSPVDVERKLTALVSEMTRAQQHLAAARDGETAAEVAYKKAQHRAFHHSNCPQVERGRVTVAERDAWVDEAVEDEWETYKLASTQREIAQDGLRVTLAIAETVRSLGASVRTAYSLSGSA